MNTEVFTCWVEQLLLPNLPEKSVVVMDNATFHKGKDMQKMIEDSGHTLIYLPPYSPDLNPYFYPQIKKCYMVRKIKHLKEGKECMIR